MFPLAVIFVTTNSSTVIAPPPIETVSVIKLPNEPVEVAEPLMLPVGTSTLPLVSNKIPSL